MPASRSPWHASTWILVFAALAGTMALHAQGTALPDAPSATITLVNGRAYHRPTRKEDFKAYEHEVIGPRAFIGAAFRSGIEQARTVPVGWGQDWPGYGQRYGSAYAEIAIDSSVRFGLAAALHEDTRYLICHHCSLGVKFENALLAEVTNRHGVDGHRRLSVVPVVATFSGPLVAYSAWYPPTYGPGEAAGHAAFGLTTHVFGHMVREVFFDHDRKPKP
ncbi:MAG: hypothetical protein P4L10_06100 [Acidobacteriaceae bacterium]|nr:hypothetical protein [Acidobacteriaceae bacterium]